MASPPSAVSRHLVVIDDLASVLHLPIVAGQVAGVLVEFVQVLPVALHSAEIRSLLSALEFAKVRIGRDAGRFYAAATGIPPRQVLPT